MENETIETTRVKRPLAQRIFISSEERRLRLGWRLAGQILLFALFAFALAPVAGLLIGVLAIRSGGFSIDLGMVSVEALAIGMGFQVLAAILSVYVARRFLDRRTFLSLGLVWDRRSMSDLLFGIVVAGVMMGSIFIIEWAAGWLELTGLAWQSDELPSLLGQTAIMLAVFLVVGWYEELVYRGYWLQNLSEGLNKTWGVVLSSLVFALVHAANPNASLNGLVGIALAGVFLAYCYLISGSLWLPVGVHIGWNFFEGTVFGFPVSGLETWIYRLLRPTVQGPPIWTGGAFGPEAGLVLLPALALGVGAVYLYVRERRRLPAPGGDRPGRLPRSESSPR